MFQGIENLTLAIPSTLALTTQFWILAHSDKRQLLKQNWPICLFFLGVFGICFIEFISYIDIVNPNLYSMKLFYVSCSAGFSGLLIFAMRISGIEIFQKYYAKYIVLISCILFSVFMLLTDSMVKGVASIGYSVTRVPGNLYFIAQFYAVIQICLIIYCLSTGLKISENSIFKKQAKVLLYSTSPFLFIFLALVFLMAIGFNVNASVIVPLATTYMLLVLIFTEEKDKLFPILLKIPFTSERKSFKAITTQIEKFLTQADNGTQASLKLLTSSIEKEIVSLAVNMINGSQIKAASLLNISASSLCRRKAEKIRRKVA